MPRPTRLTDVFGIRVHVDTASYVDRGQLDERLRSLLTADRHIVIHGDSKQGKSWLRSRLLEPDETMLVQCQPGQTPEQLLTEALGTLNIRAEINRKTVGGYEGGLEIEANADLGIKILAKLGIVAKTTGKLSKQNEIDTAPVGRTPADLNWVAKVIAASERRLVLEDFHYISEQHRQEAAFVIKLLGDYCVFVIIVGVWPNDHLLSYYNGDLEGRIEDIHLTWSSRELEQVLNLGATQLGISFSPGVREALVADAYGNVGLLQRLAESLCREEGVLARRSDALFITVSDSLGRARAAVASSMRGRYESFADSFVLGLRRLREGLEVYRYILQVVTEATDEDLQAGLQREELLQRINAIVPSKIRRSDLTNALQRLERLQIKIGLRPLVLTYSRSSQKLWVVDKSFLFFRKYGEPHWPWEEPDFHLINDLASSNPLDING